MPGEDARLDTNKVPGLLAENNTSAGNLKRIKATSGGHRDRTR